MYYDKDNYTDLSHVYLYDDINGCVVLVVQTHCVW